MTQSRIIDADGHVMEQMTLDWEKVLPEELRDRAPKQLPSDIGGTVIAGQVQNLYYPQPVVREQEGAMTAWHSMDDRSGMWDPKRRIPDMDIEGIDVAVLFGASTGLGASGLRDKRLAAAMARGYNEWLADYCSADPDRLKGVAAVALQDVDVGVAELRRSVKEHGFVGACVPVNIMGRAQDDPDYDPLYAAAQELDVPICIHNTTAIPGPGWDRFTSFVRQKAILDPFEMMIASMTMILGGVFDRFPGLRVAYLESGAGWVPYWMDRLEDYYEEFKEIRLKQDPPDYFRSEQCFVSCEVDETTLGYVADAIGDDRIIYASDYLHHDCKFPRSVTAITERPELSEETKAKILGENAQRLFRF